MCVRAPSTSQSSDEAIASQSNIFVRNYGMGGTSGAHIEQKAVAAFKGRYEDEISFNMDDIVNVLQVRII